MTGAPIYETDVIRGRPEPSSAVIRTSSTPLHGIVSRRSLHGDGNRPKYKSRQLFLAIAQSLKDLSAQRRELVCVCRNLLRGVVRRLFQGQGTDIDESWGRQAER